MFGHSPMKAWLRYTGHYFLVIGLFIGISTVDLFASDPSRAGAHGKRATERNSLPELLSVNNQASFEPAVVPTTVLSRKLASSSPVKGENLSRSVALSADGNTMVVGAFSQNGTSGAAYIFERNGTTWEQRKRLSVATGQNDWFGVSVAIEGDTVVVGSSRYNSYAGAIYIFGRNQGGSNNWGLVQQRQASDADGGDSFGFSLALQGDLLVVGARFDDEKGSSAGAIYFLGRNQGGTNNWGQISKKLAADGVSGDHYGHSLALQGDLLAVRSHKTSGSGVLGAVYFYGRNEGGTDTWGQIKKIDVGVADDNTKDQYDYPIGLDGDTLVVGAYLANLRGPDSGAAYVFARNQGGVNNWGLVQTLFAEDTDGGDNLGKAVAIEGDYILVGASAESSITTGAGAAYLFARNQGGQNQWGLVTKFIAPTADANSGDNLGRTVALRNGLAVVGAFSDDLSQTDTDTGALYLHVLTGGPTVQLDATTYSVNESGGSVAMQVTLNAAATTAVTVNYVTSNGTASTPGDYTATSGTVTFNPGETSKTVNVPIVNDTLVEADETFNFTLSNATNASLSSPVSAIITIVDDDLPMVQWSATALSVNENAGIATLQATLNAASSKIVTVNYVTSNGTAVAASDYTATSGTVTFNPGETSKAVNVSILNDNLTESNETFNLTLSSPANATLGTPASAVITLLDNDPPTVQWSAAAYNVNESAGTVTLQVTLSAAWGKTITVNYATSNGAAIATSDYTAANGTVIFNPGETSKSVSVSIINDSAPESDETLSLSLSSPSNATLGLIAGTTVTILDDDPSIIQFSAADYNASEKNGTATVQVTLNAASSKTVTVNYATSNGTASSPEDYAAANGTVSFAPGETSKLINVSIISNDLAESSETFNLTLSSPTNAMMGIPASTVVTILDGDPITVQFSAASYTVNEADGTGTIVVTLNRASANRVTVNYSTSDGAALAPDDYSAANGTITFSPGELSKTFGVSIVDDSKIEAEEIVNLILSSPTHVPLGSLFGATLTILDDDKSVVAFGTEVISVTEGSTATVQVFLSPASLKTVSVNYATSDATALATTDYTATVGILSFAPGEQNKAVPILVKDDDLPEPEKSFNVILSNPVNAAIGSNCCRTVQIADDDPIVIIDRTPITLYLPVVSYLPGRPTSWQELGGRGLQVTALALYGNQLFAGVRDANGGLYTRNLAGCTTNPALQRIGSVTADTVLDVAFLDAQGYGVLAAYGGGTFYSTDGGVTWTPSASKPLFARSIALTGEQGFYAGTETNGIYNSPDNGINWLQKTINPKAINRVKLDTLDPNLLWIATEDQGVWRLNIGLDRLLARNDGLTTPDSKKVWDFAFDASGQIYLATFDGVFAGDGAQAWQRLGTALNGRKLQTIAIANNQFYVGGRDTGVWQRPLAGGDWTGLVSPGWNPASTVRDLLYVADGPCQGLLAATNDGVWIYR